MIEAEPMEERRDILFTTRMTRDETNRIDELCRKLNADKSRESRVTRSTLTRRALEMFLDQAGM
jgi:hypothetical protein